MNAWFATAFLTGLVSSLHCVGMCGPLVAALPMGRLPHRQRWWAVGLYHTGRVATYATLGALTGSFSLGLYLLGWQRPLAVGLGVLVLVGFLWRRTLPAQLRWDWLNRRIVGRFQALLRQPGWSGFLLLGVLNGLLPCGFTYLALAGTLATHTPTEGAAYMLLFGLGTLPALLGVNLVLGWLPALGRQWLNRVLSMATVLVALLLIFRGLADYALPVHPSHLIPLCRGLLTP